MHHRCCLETAAHFMQMQLIEGEPNSVTDLDLLAQSGQWARYELKPHTGKRHQLRVVMNALGVPILNDGIYPLLTPETPEPDYTKPLQLLAQQLSFTDPLTNALREFKSLRALSWPVK
jgi:tRNA pseudouridine32 synthase/23S rRNA pseudouridine746 synthase